MDGDAMQHGVDMHDAEVDAQRAELEAWAKEVVGQNRKEVRDHTRERDLYLEMLAEEVRICEEALSVARARYRQVEAWRPDETPRVDRDLPGMDRGQFGRHDDGEVPPREYQVAWPA